MNFLKENNHLEKISSYTKLDWKPLLDLIPKIEKVKKFGDDKGAMKLLQQGLIDMNSYVEDEIVEEFRQVCYSIPIIIDFDWGSWDEGQKGAEETALRMRFMAMAAMEIRPAPVK